MNASTARLASFLTGARAKFVLATMLVACTAGAHGEDAPGLADDSGKPSFSFSGFGTVGLVHSSEDQADYTSSVFKPNGAGHSRSWSADPDTRLGLQGTANLTPHLSAVLQVISEQNYDSSYSPHVEWANIKYAFTPDFSIRLGRIAMTTFLVGDYRKVAYSLPWVRMPSDVFGIMPVTNNDGVDASYRLHAGEVTNTLQGMYGRDKVNTPANLVATTAKNTWGLFDTLEYGSTTLRASYISSYVNIGTVTPFFDLFRQFGPSGIAIADKYSQSDKHISLLAFGASYDPGNWFLMAEWIKGRFDSFIGDRSAWYASGGYRFGNVTPYVIYSQSRKLTNTSDPGLDLTFLPPPVAAQAGALNAGLNRVLQPTTATTITLGGRWDFAKNVDLKLQYEHLKLDANSSGPLTNLQPGFQLGSKVNVISTSIDFVF